MTKGKTIISILCMSILLGGCYSGPMMSQGDRDRMNTSNDERHETRYRDKSENNGTKSSMDSAREIALNDAGVSESDVDFEVETSYTKHGDEVAKFVFKDRDTVYIYEISMNSGEIYFSKSNSRGGNGNYSHGNRNYSNGNGSNHRMREHDCDPSEYISIDDAKAIALDSVNLTEAEVTMKKLKLDDYDRRWPKYEVEFKVNDQKYEFEIDAVTGDILEMEIDD